MSQLLDFLTNLALDPKQQQAFEKEPDALMAAARLSESERTAINSRNSAQITAIVADEHFQAALTVVVPNPDPFPDPDPPSPPDSPSEPSEKDTEAIAFVQT